MKRAHRLAGLVLVAVVLELLLTRMMAHGHVAHALLGGGAGAGTALFACAFVVVRVTTVLFAPGLVLAAATLAVADRVRRDGGGQRLGAGAAPEAEPEAKGSGTGEPGVHSISTSVADAAGTSIGSRGTV